jgi:serine/threonine protein kinase
MYYVAEVVPSARHDLPGVPFGKYRILRKLGQGGVGAVYEALLPGPMGFSKRVAIKRLRPAVVSQNPWLHEAMVNEAIIGGMLHHDNIVDVLEFDRAGRHYYIAMEYVDGLTLGEIVRLCRARRALLPRFAVIRLAIDVCRGLHHAHRLRGADGRRVGLVHRDLKPSNIMVSRSGTAKILDFGIAKAATVALDTTTQATVKGTPRYMSPEQITGGRELGPPSDLFSLATVLYELATLEPAYQGSSIISLALKIVDEDPAALAWHADEVVPGLGPILELALSKHPAQRYRSAQAMAADLRRLARRYPAEADMGEVIGRLLPARDLSGVHMVRSPVEIDRDASVVPLQVPAFDPAAVAIMPLDPHSAGWRPFLAAFDVVQTSENLEDSTGWPDSDIGAGDSGWEDTCTAETRDLHLATTLTQARSVVRGALAGLADRVKRAIRPRADSGRVPPLPGWAIARLAVEPDTGTVPALPDWAIERLAMRDETGAIVPLPGWAIARLRGDDFDLEVLPLPDWAILELANDDHDPLPLPATAILHLVPAAAFRRNALLAGGIVAVAVIGLLSLGSSLL